MKIITQYPCFLIRGTTHTLNRAVLFKYLKEIPPLRVKSLEWYKRHKNRSGAIERIPFSFAEPMSEFCGLLLFDYTFQKNNDIIKIIINDPENGMKNYSWSLEMFELTNVDENIIKYEYR